MLIAIILFTPIFAVGSFYAYRSDAPVSDYGATSGIAIVLVSWLLLGRAIWP